MNGDDVENPITTIARKALRDIDPAPFTLVAFKTLQRHVDEYIEELVLESVRIMKRHHSDTVSPKYVEQASGNLSAIGRRRWFTLAGTLGGILFGAAVSSFLEMSKASSVGGSQAILAGVLAAIGAAMIAVQFSRE